MPKHRHETQNVFFSTESSALFFFIRRSVIWHFIMKIQVNVLYEENIAAGVAKGVVPS